MSTPKCRLLFSLSVVSDSVTPWTAAHQASLSFTTCSNLLKLLSIESAMPPKLPDHLSAYMGINFHMDMRRKMMNPTRRQKKHDKEGLHMCRWALRPVRAQSSRHLSPLTPGWKAALTSLFFR